MAILQVVTATKTGSSFANLEEAQAAYATDTGADALKSYILTALSNNDFTLNVEWDIDTQTITYNRTWDETAYNTYVSSNTEARATAKANAEAAGWTLEQTISTV